MVHGALVFMQVLNIFLLCPFLRHTVRHSLAQLSAVLVKHETPDRWPALLTLLNQSTKSNNPQDRQVTPFNLFKKSTVLVISDHYHIHIPCFLHGII